MIRVKYTAAIRRQVVVNGSPVYAEEAIGIQKAGELFAAAKEVVGLIRDVWSSNAFHALQIEATEEVPEDKVPAGSFVYVSAYSGYTHTEGRA
jgi:hypothetical protein